MQCNGQAIVEFIVGLVAILVIAGFIVQVGRIAQAHTLALTEARAAAGGDAMGDVYLSVFPGPRYIAEWQAGPDGATYSKDDTITSADPGLLSADILSHSRPQEIQRWVPDNEITVIAADPNVEAFVLVHGHAEAEDPIEILPVIRHLLYNMDEIEVEADVWLTWTKGLY